MYRADSLAFLALPGMPPLFDPEHRPKLDLAHLPSVPKFENFNVGFAAHLHFRKQALLNPDTHEVLNREDLDRPGLGLIFGMQVPQHVTLAQMQTLSDAGVRFMGLTYDDKACEYGSSFMTEGGLTPRGCELIEWMGECGIILDLSHANHATAHEALYCVKKGAIPVKVAITHSGCKSEYEHSRNLDSDTMRSIADLEGYIGVFLTSFFLCREDLDPFASFVNHLYRAMRTIGLDNVGVGSNCPHLNMSMEAAQEYFERMNGHTGGYFPDRPPALIELGSEMLPLIRQCLLAQGLPTLTTDCLCGENFQNFLKRSLPSRA